MNLLLDTHIFLWWCDDHSLIKENVRSAIRDAEKVFVSVASAWETAVKIGLGKVQLPRPFSEGIEASGFHSLPIAFAHAARVATLPHHHMDPFDRMLIAQAQVEHLTFVTADWRLEPYDVPVLLG